jgi:hypothetical protein
VPAPSLLLLLRLLLRLLALAPGQAFVPGSTAAEAPA